MDTKLVMQRFALRCIRATTAVAMVALYPACDAAAPIASADTADSGPDTDGEDRGPLGKADRTGSCSVEDGNLCGSRSMGTCWCDESCDFFGDCCEDYVGVCVDPPETPELTVFDEGWCEGEPVDGPWLQQHTEMIEDGELFGRSVGTLGEYQLLIRDRLCDGEVCGTWSEPRVWADEPGVSGVAELWVLDRFEPERASLKLWSGTAFEGNDCGLFEPAADAAWYETFDERGIERRYGGSTSFLDEGIFQTIGQYDDVPVGISSCVPRVLDLTAPGLMETPSGARETELAGVVTQSCFQFTGQFRRTRNNAPDVEFQAAVGLKFDEQP